MRCVFAFGWSQDARSRRTMGLLLTLWVLGCCDYLFTLWAQRFTPFHEVNPWAGVLLRHHQSISLGLGKCVLTGFGTIVFWASRHRRLTQAGLWGLFVLHIALMVRWSSYTAIVLADGQTDVQASDLSYLPPLPLPPREARPARRGMAASEAPISPARRAGTPPAEGRWVLAARGPSPELAHLR